MTWEYSIGGGGRPQRILDMGASVESQTGHEAEARLSPDRRLIAYSSNVTGRWEVYLDTFPPSGHPRRVSIDGGDRPRWNRDGRELLFRADRAVMSASRSSQSIDAFLSRPTTVVSITEDRLIDFAPDGDQIILNVTVNRLPTPPLTVVLNWHGR